MLERPKDFHEYDITMDPLIELSSLQEIIGARFLLKEIDLFFSVDAAHLRSDGLQFSIQYESIRCVQWLCDLATAHSLHITEFPTSLMQKN